jgi:hypothetical protein
VPHCHWTQPRTALFKKQLEQHAQTLPFQLLPRDPLCSIPLFRRSGMSKVSVGGSEGSSHSLATGPTSRVSHFASTATTSDETHQFVTFVFLSPSFSPFRLFHSQLFPSSSLVPISNQPPDHASPQQDMAEPSSEPKSNIRERLGRRSWNIVAIFFKDMWRQHKRVKPLGKGPGVRRSIIAIMKTSCEYPTVDTLYLPTDLSML